MKWRYFIVVVLGLLIPFKMVCQSQTFQWVKQVGGSGMDFGRAITSDAAGNVYVTGNFADTCDFDPSSGIYTLTASSSIEMFVAKYDGAGTLVWTKQFPATGGYSMGNGIAVGPNNIIYITGKFSGTVDFDPGTVSYTLASSTNSFSSDADAFVLKLDVNGNFISAINYGLPGVNDGGRSLAVNSFGNGFVSVVENTGPGQDAIRVYNLANSLSYTIGAVSSTDAVSFSGLAMDNSGNSIVAGSFKGKASFGTNTITSQSQTYDIFVSMFSPSGTLTWAKRVGGNFDDYSGGVASDGSNIFLTGYFGGTVDFDPGATSYTLNTTSNDAFLLKLFGNGNFAFANCFSSYASSASYGLNIETDAQSNIYASGYFAGNVDFDPGAGINSYSVNSSSQAAYITKFSPAGSFLWKELMVSSDGITPYAMCVDVFNNVYTTGTFLGTTDFNASAVSATLAASAVNEDVFLLKTGSAVGIRELEESANGLHVYPNPSENKIYLRAPFNGRAILASVTGIEIAGIEVQAGKVISFNIADVAAGVYFVICQDELTGETCTKQVVKKQ